MTAFVWQTLLLIALAYVLGCWTACLIRRMASRSPMVVADSGQGAVAATATAPVPLETVRGPSPVMPPPQRVPTPVPAPVGEAFRRADFWEPPADGARPSAAPPSRPLQPERVAPSSSVSRFERALSGPGGQGSVAAGAPPLSGPSDLRRIRGIDAPLATQLQDLGVRSFAEIGAWKKADVARISKALGFKGRIEQENWIEQAQILASGKETYYSRQLVDPAAAERRTVAPAKLTGSQPAATQPQPQTRPLPRTESQSSTRPAEVQASGERVVSQRIDAAATATAAAMAAAAASALAGSSISRASPPASKPADAAGRPAAAELAAKPAPPSATPPAVQRSAVSARDNLRLIEGITPEIEQLLNAHGVTRHGQIAQWVGADIERYGRLLGQPARIQREAWVEQARALVRGGDKAQADGPGKPPQPVTRVQAPSQPMPAAPVTTSTSSAVPAAAEATSAKPISPPAATPRAEPIPSSPATAEVAPKPDAGSGSTAAPVVASEAVAGAAVASLATIAATALGDRSVSADAPPTEGTQRPSPEPPHAAPARAPDAPDRDGAEAPRTGGDLVGLRSVRSEDQRGAAVPFSGRATGIDDLKRIRGIGVLIEKKLNSMGVTHYEQIAKWTSVDIDRVSHVLDFKGRIERENWVEQARILASGGHTEFSRRADRGDFGGM